MPHMKMVKIGNLLKQASIKPNGEYDPSYARSFSFNRLTLSDGTIIECEKMTLQIEARIIDKHLSIKKKHFVEPYDADLPELYVRRIQDFFFKEGTPLPDLEHTMTRAEVSNFARVIGLVFVYEGFMASYLPDLEHRPPGISRLGRLLRPLSKKKYLQKHTTVPDKYCAASGLCLHCHALPPICHTLLCEKCEVLSLQGGSLTAQQTYLDYEFKLMQIPQNRMDSEEFDAFVELAKLKPAKLKADILRDKAILQHMLARQSLLRKTQKENPELIGSEQQIFLDTKLREALAPTPLKGVTKPTPPDLLESQVKRLLSLPASDDQFALLEAMASEDTARVSWLVSRIQTKKITDKVMANLDDDMEDIYREMREEDEYGVDVAREMARKRNEKKFEKEMKDFRESYGPTKTGRKKNKNAYKLSKKQKPKVTEEKFGKPITETKEELRVRLALNALFAQHDRMKACEFETLERDLQDSDDDMESIYNLY